MSLPSFFLLRWLLVASIVLGLSWGISGQPTTAAALTCDRALWVWGSKPALTPAARARLFDFAEAHCVQRLYQESQTLLVEEPAALTAYLAEAATRGLEVELLFGAAGWALAGEHAIPIDLAERVITFTQELTPTLRPAGLHFDIEPHTLPEWDADMNTVANQYLDLLEALAARTCGSGLRLAVDIPFWYDNRLVTRNQQTQPFSEWVIDRVDVVTLMAYRDRATPPDGLIDLAAAEIAYAQSVGKQVIIGVETNCGLLPTKITFCEEGPAALEQALQQTRTVYATYSAFAGFALHDYDGYQALTRLRLYLPLVRR